ncbi:MAG: hypothetical protein M9895_07540 [Aquamicrobium sp.]|uniref:DUF6665 family protein n=1 Tax=Aquamicrobium sp. TaxID=1872579 RepID=UPI00349EF69C|nr:hypothetical protein [Aquamicrobium sp.]
MSLRPPSRFSASALSGSAGDGLFALLDHEIAAEKASSLGRAGEKVEKTLARLRDCGPSSAERPQCLKAAVQAVYAYFIQRELCGLRRHHDAIRDYAIPAEVLVRLGAA